MKTYSACLFGLIIFLLSPFVMAQEEEDAENQSSNVCVNSRTIRNFDAFTDEHIYVKEGGDDHYLFTMRGRCIGLKNSLAIAIKDTTSRVCSKSFGEVVYRDNRNRTTSCRIDTIEAVESKDDAKALVQRRKEEKDKSE
jgi:hypothetical protein